LAYHVVFFLNRFGKLVNYSGQGVEKINDDIKKIHQSKTNKYDATVDALKVRKRIEYLKLDGCERTKRDYTKSDERYWDEEIYSQRNAKKSRIAEEMNIAAEKFSCNDENPVDLSSLSTDEIKARLKTIGVKTKLRNREKLLDLLISHTQQ